MTENSDSNVYWEKHEGSEIHIYFISQQEANLNYIFK